MAQRSANKQPSSDRIQTILTVSLAVLFLIIASGIGYMLFQQIRELVISSDILPNLTTGNLDGEGTYSGIGPLPNWLELEGPERVNILLLGIDERCQEDGPWRTDTMLVLTVDPLTKSAGILSIPRDLWVPIPGHEEARINTANYFGDANNYPGGGPALAMQTVQWNLGIYIHHYVRVNFSSFIKAVDLIGGIDIYVEEEIRDDTYPDSCYGFDPLYIPAGWVSMDGELALKYARTRHSEGGDFSRAQRQQQVLMAILDKVVRLDILPQLAPQSQEIWNMVNESVATDLTVEQMVALANLATEIDPNDIRRGVIDENYTQFWTTPEGWQVLVPVRDQIRELRDYVFRSESNSTGEQTLEERLAAEAATVEVQNGTIIVGLASSTSEYLQGSNIPVTNVGNADRSDYAESMIIVYTGKSLTAETIADLLNLPQTAIVPMDNSQATIDIVVILGNDYEPLTP